MKTRHLVHERERRLGPPHPPMRLRRPDGGRAFCPGGVFDRKTQTAILSDPLAPAAERPVSGREVAGWNPA